MSWGDPYDKLYRDANFAQRKNTLIRLGLVPGALVTVGKRDWWPVYGWLSPNVSSEMIKLSPGIGSVLALDCESDPVVDWLLVMLPGQKICWLLATSVTVVGDDVSG